MFETRAEIRRVARERVLAKERDKGLREGRRRYSSRIAEARQRFGVRDEATGEVRLVVTPEVEEFLLGEPDNGD